MAVASARNGEPEGLDTWSPRPDIALLLPQIRNASASHERTFFQILLLRRGRCWRSVQGPATVPQGTPPTCSLFAEWVMRHKSLIPKVVVSCSGALCHVATGPYSPHPTPAQCTEGPPVSGTGEDRDTFVTESTSPLHLNLCRGGLCPPPG